MDRLFKVNTLTEEIQNGAHAVYLIHEIKVSVYFVCCVLVRKQF